MTFPAWIAITISRWIVVTGVETILASHNYYYSHQTRVTDTNTRLGVLCANIAVIASGTWVVCAGGSVGLHDVDVEVASAARSWQSDTSRAIVTSWAWISL